MENYLKSKMNFKMSIIYVHLLFCLFTSLYRDLNIVTLSVLLITLGAIYIVFNNGSKVKLLVIFILNSLLYFIAFYWILLISFNIFNYEFMNAEDFTKENKYYVLKVNEAKKINMYLEIYKSYQLYVAYNHVADDYFEQLNLQTQDNKFVNKVINLEFDKYKSIKNGASESIEYKNNLGLLLDSIVMSKELTINKIAVEFLNAHRITYYSWLKNNKGHLDINTRLDILEKLNIKLDKVLINRLLNN